MWLVVLTAAETASLQGRAFHSCLGEGQRGIWVRSVLFLVLSCAWEGAGGWRLVCEHG